MRRRARAWRKTLLGTAAALACLLPVALAGCGAAEGTSGPEFSVPASITRADYNASAATGGNGAYVDTSSVASGYVAASATSSARLKLQVLAGDASYNYDLPSDGTPIAVPLNMGDGHYTFRVMQNTTGNSYVELFATEADVAMTSEFEPYLRPNLYCSYDDDSECVALARELAAGCENEGDVLREVYTYITENISYDTAKAQQLADTTGYIPNPDATLSEGTGICFDYSSLAAAMLRSLGIPCKIVTGYVSPDGIYHAWNLIYLDGGWTSAKISVDANTWTIMDTTFAAAGADGAYTGDGSSYTERYVY